MRYRDQDTRDEIQRAADIGVPVPKIAERAHMEVRELCELMHWPQWQEIPAGGDDDQPADYLWSVDRLDGVL